MVAPTLVFGRLRHFRRFEQRFDGVCGGFAEHPVGCRLIVRLQQSGGLRRLPQQFGAGALAQLFGVERLHRVHAAHAVDARAGGDRVGNLERGRGSNFALARVGAVAISGKVTLL
jgi:hypothetical protein